MAAGGEIDTQNIAWAKNKGNFGFKMLQKMGWKEGNGLGKNQDGRTAHVKVAVRSDNTGVGLDADKTGNRTLQAGFNSFASVLDNLKAHHGSSSKPRGLTAAVARGHKISYTKVLRNKDVSGYSKKDLAAILGVTLESTTFTPVPSFSAVGGTKRSRSTDSADEGEEEGGASSSKKARKAAKAAKKAAKAERKAARAEKKAAKAERKAARAEKRAAKAETKAAKAETSAAQAAAEVTAAPKKAKKEKKAKKAKTA